MLSRLLDSGFESLSRAVNFRVELLLPLRNVVKLPSGALVSGCENLHAGPLQLKAEPLFDRLQLLTQIWLLSIFRAAALLLPLFFLRQILLKQSLFKEGLPRPQRAPDFFPTGLLSPMGGGRLPALQGCPLGLLLRRIALL